MWFIPFAWASPPPKPGFTRSSSSCSSPSPCLPSWPSRQRHLLERDHHIDAKRHLIIIAEERIIRRMIPADFRAEFQVRPPLIVGEWLDGQPDGGLINIVDGPKTIAVAVVNPLNAAFEREHRIKLIRRQQRKSIELRIAAIGRAAGFPDVIHVCGGDEILCWREEQRSIPSGSLVAVVIGALRAG